MLPIRVRHSFLQLALVCTTTATIGLVSPVYSTAAQGSPQSSSNQQTAHEEERAARAKEREEERAKHDQEHSEERAAREREREARKAKREEERAARHASGSGHNGSTDQTGEAGEPGSNPSTGTDAQPSGRTLRGCRLSVQSSADRVLAGETVTVSGVLQCPESDSKTVSVAGLPVSLYQHASGADAGTGGAASGSGKHSTGDASITATATGTTQSDGAFELTSSALYTNTALQVRVGSVRARAIVKVAPLVTLTDSPSTPQTSATGAATGDAGAAGAHPHAQTRPRETFSGTVSPIAAGAPVVLQVCYAPSSEKWRTVGRGRVAADGSFSIEHSFRIPGQASVRAIVRVGKHNLPGVSAPLVYEVSQPENPQLTIQTSADPLADGQQVTISGIAAGLSDQQVTLFAHTAGGSFTAVATATTDASGDYTFTEEPSQSTYYRVTDAAAQSTTLFEAVAKR